MLFREKLGGLEYAAFHPSDAYETTLILDEYRAEYTATAVTKGG